MFSNQYFFRIFYLNFSHFWFLRVLICFRAFIFNRHETQKNKGFIKKSEKHKYRNIFRVKFQIFL